VTQLKRYQDERKRLNERNAAYMGEWKDELSSKIQKPGGGKPAGSGPDDGYSLQGKSQRRAWRGALLHLSWLLISFLIGFICRCSAREERQCPTD